jgi:LysR family transcriptional regulator of beta-lactamase
MIRSHLPLDALRAFEVAARHLSSTKACMVFDSAVTMAEAAAEAAGTRYSRSGRPNKKSGTAAWSAPSMLETSVGDYWLTSLNAKQPITVMQAFRKRIVEATADEDH